MKRVHKLLLFIILATASTSVFSDIGKVSINKNENFCIKMFGEYIPIPTKFILFPSSSKMPSNESFTLSCINETSCYPPYSSGLQQGDTGSISIAVGRSPHEIISRFDSDNTYLFVSKYDVNELQVRVYEFRGMAVGGYKTGLYIALIYDKTEYIGVINRRAHLWKDVIESMGSEDVCWN